MPKRNAVHYLHPGNWSPPRRFALKPIASVLTLSLLTSTLAWNQSDNRNNGPSANELREYIGQQVGGLNRLTVPAEANIPVPRLANGQPDPRFVNTEAKRFLGKMLFFDPIRMVRIKPEFGGVTATRQTASCGSCHLGEAASKAGTLLNFAAGGEGRGYTDEDGNFVPRRRPRTDLLPRLRNTPLFPGDALVDELPTLTDIYAIAGPSSPARARKLPPPGDLLRTGRLDALDSVARNAPGVLGAAFNNRLLLGGFAGEPDSSPGGLNPFDFPAQESVALLLLDAHRMLDFEAAELQRFPVYVRLFRLAFPEEAAMADSARDLNLLINDITVLRATATFMRTSVTRNTPFDRFLAGSNRALSARQRRGAELFFTSADKGGAGCFSCHSGPMLNKQVNDPDVTGMGQFVEENFFNIGLGDHPLQALNRAARQNPQFIDDGRFEITARSSDLFKFRTVTLRQLKDARTFMHNGAFTSVRDVVEYFNNGVPQNAVTGAAPTLTPRFTNPRGPGSQRGLGLEDRDIDAITDFLENGVYDPAFATYDPRSTTRTFQPTPQDMTYSVYRPDLAALGARDGYMPSGLPVANNDALSRRDMGLEFLNVTGQIRAERINTSVSGRLQEDTWRITNNSTTAAVDTHLLLVVRGLSDAGQLSNASAISTAGQPYLRIFLPEGQLQPGQSIVRRLRIQRPNASTPVTGYALDFLSGQGNP
jgi:cytochrome c peroxidase